MHDDPGHIADPLANPIAAYGHALFSLLVPGSGLLVAAYIADEDSVAHFDRSRLAVAGAAWLALGVVTATCCGLVSIASAVHTWSWIRRYAIPIDDGATWEGHPEDPDELAEETVYETVDETVEEDLEPLDDDVPDDTRFTEADLRTWPRRAHDGPLGDDLEEWIDSASEAALERDLAGPDNRARRSEALVHATVGRRPEVVHWLLAHGADINHQLDGSGTPLSNAEEPAMMALLLERGADPNHRSENDSHPLNYAIDGFRADEVELLLAHGADPEGGTDSERPLLNAASRANTRAVAALVAAGADVTVTDAYGLTALDHARVVERTGFRDPNQEMLAILSAAGAPEGSLDTLDRAVEAAFGPWFRDGWLPVTEGGPGPDDGSRFGGRPWLPAGSAWPHSDAGRPMAFGLQLALAELPPRARAQLGDPASGLLQLFFDPEDSWNTSEVRIVQPGEGGLGDPPEGVELYPARTIIGWTTFRDSPGPSEVSRGPLPDHLRDAEREHSEYMLNSVRVGDKLGGWPRWVQGVTYPPCRTCGTPRSNLVFQLGPEQNLGESWGDVGSAYVLACPGHPDDLALVVQSH